STPLATPARAFGGATRRKAVSISLRLATSVPESSLLPSRQLCHEGVRHAARIASGETGDAAALRDRSASPAMSSAMNVPPVKAGSPIGMIAALSIGIGGLGGGGIFFFFRGGGRAGREGVWGPFGGCGGGGRLCPLACR